MPVTARSSKIGTADASLIAAAAIWGATFVVVQDAVEALPPLRFVGWRFLLAGLILLPSVSRHLRNKKIWVAGILVGLAMFVGFAFQTWALTRTTPARVAFLTGLSVVMVPLAGFLLQRRIPGRATLTGVALAMGGLAFWTGPGNSGFGAGDLAGIGCAIGFAAQILLLGRFSSEHPPFALLAVECLTVAALALPLGLLLEPAGVMRDPAVLRGMAITVVLATIVAFGIQNWAQRRVSPTRTGLILILEPVFAAFTSAILGRERLDLRAWIGASLILVGMLIAELGPRKSSD